MGLEPMHRCLTGTRSATELPTLVLQNSKHGFQLRFPHIASFKSGTPESNREPQASKAHVLPIAPLPEKARGAGIEPARLASKASHLRLWIPE